jgi:hypothetical protein
MTHLNKNHNSLTHNRTLISSCVYEGKVNDDFLNVSIRKPSL